jgi:hypothetical protein
VTRLHQRARALDLGRDQHEVDSRLKLPLSHDREELDASRRGMAETEASQESAIRRQRPTPLRPGTSRGHRECAKVTDARLKHPTMARNTSALQGRAGNCWLDLSWIKAPASPPMCPTTRPSATSRLRSDPAHRGIEAQPRCHSGCLFLHYCLFRASLSPLFSGRRWHSAAHGTSRRPGSEHQPLRQPAPGSATVDGYVSSCGVDTRVPAEERRKQE